MSLSAGTRLGPYEIVAPIGEGGMGEVYRARDTRLNREVAIKTSAAKFSERFDLEARAIAALNHPHICQIYDVGPDYIVMELVDGAPVKGPLPLDQALDLAIQLAGAMEAAHRKGITHRDLKPANILSTKSGIKVLDFGLAKVHASKLPGAADATLTKALTQEGSIVGTLQYMAPEQLNGKEGDSRADIFSFGCVLYEVVTGKRAFDGPTAASVIGAVLEREPPSLGGVAPAALDRVLKTCLAKDPDQRWQTATDLKRELEWIASGGGVQTVAPASRSRVNRLLGLAAAACALGFGAVSFVHFREKPPEALLTRFTMAAPPGTRFPVAGGEAPALPILSPDGHKLVFRAVSKDGVGQLWFRSLDTVDARPMPGTERGFVPFWSPDSKSIGFFVGRQLMRIDVAGGPALTVADIGTNGTSASGAWSPEGTILFSRRSTGPLFRISASGGTVTEATRLEPEKETGHVAPWFLPDGKSFLFVALGQGRPVIRAGRLGSTDSKVVEEGGDGQTIYSSGNLIFSRGGVLLAQPFDAERLVPTGDAVPIAERILNQNYGASANGVLVYAAGASEDTTQMIWYDRQGKKLGVVGTPAVYSNPALSGDDKRLAVSIADQSGMRDIWIFDLVRAVPTRFTFDPKDDLNPAWSSDGSRIAFSSERSGPRNIYWKASSGAGAEELLVDSKDPKSVEDWSPDGKFILYNAGGTQGIWAIGVTGDRKPFPVFRDPFTVRDARISPDGHWIAYRSNESGRNEIFVQSFAPSAGKWQISNSGGAQPSWRGDGKELYYVNRTRMMAVALKVTGTGIEAGIPEELFNVPELEQTNRRNVYVVTHDGKRFLCLTTVEDVNATPLTLVLNWTAALKK